ncbi:hypothetical protein Tco_0336639 [Tanacetum coccineum]
MSYSEQTHLVNYPENEITSDSNIIPYSQYLLETQNVTVQDTKYSAQQYAMILSVFEQLSNQKAQQIRTMFYDGSVIAKGTNVISFCWLKDFLLDERLLNRLSEDFGKCFVPQQELSDEQAFRLQTSHPNTDQSASLPVKIEAPRELPKYFVDKQCFEIQKKHFLIENDRLLDQIISQDIVNIVVNSSLDINTSVNVNSSTAMNDSVNYVEMCNKCLELEAELIKQHNMVEKDEYNKLSKDLELNALQDLLPVSLSPLEIDLSDGIYSSVRLWRITGLDTVLLEFSGVGTSFDIFLESSQLCRIRRIFLMDTAFMVVD